MKTFVIIFATKCWVLSHSYQEFLIELTVMASLWENIIPIVLCEVSVDKLDIFIRVDVLIDIVYPRHLSWSDFSLPVVIFEFDLTIFNLKDCASLFVERVVCIREQLHVKIYLCLGTLQHRIEQKKEQSGSNIVMRVPALLKTLSWSSIIHQNGAMNVFYSS